MGRRGAWRSSSTPRGGGQVHQGQAGFGPQLRQAEQALQGQGLAQHGIGGPAGPQCLHAFAHEAAAAEAGIAGCQQHRTPAHLPQQQAPLHQGQGRHLVSARQANGSGGKLVAMGSELLIGSPDAEAAP